MGTVAALYRYPVKSTLGESLLSVTVTPAGLTGDRSFAVMDDGARSGAPSIRASGENCCAAEAG